MNPKVETLKTFSIPMPITQKAKLIAREFSCEQPTPQAAERVYRNTLAVCAVNNYLRILGVPTDLSAGDSWSPTVRLVVDVADLEVMGLGRLECRPIQGARIRDEGRGNPRDALESGASDLARSFLPDAVCDIPREVQDDRIGYVVVGLDDLQEEATLLGFTQTVTTSTLPLSELQPMDRLLEHLASSENAIAREPAVVVLSQWLEKIFEESWQAVESFFDPLQPELAFRWRSESVRRAKQIELGSPSQSVALIVYLVSTDESKMDIRVEVRPTQGQTYLPPGLRLMLLDEGEEAVMDAQARNENQNIQFDFRGEIGDRFRIKVALGNDSITESFVI